MNIARLLIRLSQSPWLRATALLGLAALGVVSLVPAEYSPPRTELPGQVEHFIAYACTSALAAFAFQTTIRPRVVAGAFIGYAALLEFSQQWFSGRSPSALDFLGSSAGALAGIGTCALLLLALTRLEPVTDRQ